MKQNELRETLGSIRAGDERIARVMKTVAARENAKETRTAMSRLGFGMRLAAAACAFMLVFGLGIYVFRSGGFDDPVAHDYGMQRVNEDTWGTDTEEEKNEDEANSALTALLAESKNIDGDWAIANGVVNAFYFAGGEVENGVYRCLVSITVEKIQETSDGSVTCEGEIAAEIFLYSDDELGELTNAISSSINLLIEKNDDSHDAAWTVRKIIY